IVDILQTGAAGTQMKGMTGTSGISYPALPGIFYPDKLSVEKMLAFYASKLRAVEINNTFYRMPKRPMLERWAAETPASFRFALKSPRQITHMRRLVDVREMVARLSKGAAA